MKPPYITDSYLKTFIWNALKEDLREGDHTTLACIPKNKQATAELRIKKDGIIGGLQLAERIFHEINPELKFISLIQDGAPVSSGQIGFTVTGEAQSILSAERLVLNCMQRMSGIATKTHWYKSLISGTHAQLMDTRKTTPLFRLLEKWAVAIGGGVNHRLGLFDKILLKDNHIDIAGGVSEAILKVKDYLRRNNLSLEIEVETRSLEEVESVLQAGGIHTIMLDNMGVSEMKKAVRLIHGKYWTEASGNINEKNILDVAECGVDFISVGALTHSVESLDLSLKAVINN